MTEPTVERMEDGLFARFEALLFEAEVDGYVRVSRPMAGGGWKQLAAEATKAEAVRAAWTDERDNLLAERDRLHKALQALGAPVVVDSPSDTPAGPETPQEPVDGWRPMDTCPRRTIGMLTEDVWFACASGTVLRYRAGAVLSSGLDGSFGRIGWLPGHLNRSDLPPVEVTP